MKTSIKIAIAALVITSFGFEGCKKGDGDPFLSLRTRKARVAGDWTVTKGEGTYNYVWATIAISETSSYDGAIETTTTNPGNSTSTDKHTIAFTFEKKGAYTEVVTNNNGNTPSVSTTKGTWNFTGGIGDMKNKSQILLIVTSVTTGTNIVSYTGTDAPNFLYDVYELKNKEIVLKSNYTNSSSSDNQTNSYTLTAK